MLSLETNQIITFRIFNCECLNKETTCNEMLRNDFKLNLYYSSFTLSLIFSSFPYCEEALHLSQLGIINFVEVTGLTNG